MYLRIVYIEKLNGPKKFTIKNFIGTFFDQHNLGIAKKNYNENV